MCKPTILAVWFKTRPYQTNYGKEVNYMKRSEFLRAVSLTSMACFAGAIAKAVNKPRHILIVSGWQDVNIGDIAHTPGLLHILQTFFPDSQLTLWKKSRSEAVGEMLKGGFPNVRVIYGEVDRASAQVESPDVQEAFNQADILIHGSGPGLAGRYHIAAWQKYTAKPFGVFGITLESINEDVKAILSDASFIYVRERKSLGVLQSAGIQHTKIMFAPDATFWFNLLDEQKATNCLKTNQLKEKAFICVIPRLRYTPYHKIRPGAKHWMGVSNEEVDAMNDQWKEVDHAKLREVMITWVRNTGNRVLVCPEMTYQVDIMDELLIDPLPDDVKPFVAKRGYWLPDEAAAVYRQSFAVISFECHSPILAAANDTPFIYLRQPQDTIKGQMYYDLGFDNWIYEIEQSEGEEIAATVMAMWERTQEAGKELTRGTAAIRTIYQTACAGI